MIGSFEEAIYDRLRLDSTLDTQATGGFFRKEAMRLTKASFDVVTATGRNANGSFKPFVYVNGRDVVSTGTLHDHASQYVTINQVVETWVIDDPLSSMTLTNNILTSFYRLLQERPPTDAFQCVLVNGFTDFDPDFAGARTSCMEWLITAKIST